LDKFSAEEYDLPFFKETGYIRKRCPCCEKYYWTQNAEQQNCGEAGSQECAHYSFIGNSPTKRSYNLHDMRESFLNFFEKRGHQKIRPYPVVARWREDIYLTHASIIDFQPYVTDGIAPPPANPLVISQPCIRMVDIDNTGPTFGRHLTIFEMGGAHAFNYPDKEVYWKDQTVRYHHEWVTRDLGVKPEEITYKEEVWSGGGNAGPCVETIIRGLEVATLVFMQFKVVNNRFVKLPIRTVDTGYGIDRYAWLSQGVPSGFHAIYGELLTRILRMAGLTQTDNDLLSTIAKYSGVVSIDKRASRLETRKRQAELVGIDATELADFITPIENCFAIADHTKCISFILSEGVVPSNIQEGYLARLIFRRTYRLLKMLNITDRLYDIMNMQIDHWGTDFPQLKEMQNEINEMIKVEEEKFQDTIKRGEILVKRISNDLKAEKKKEIPARTLVELYDSHGLPPEIVKQAAEKENIKVDVPDDFYTLIAERHMNLSKPQEDEDAEHQQWLEAAVAGLPQTVQLYYEDQYKTKFKAMILRTIEGDYVVLDRTCFFPEGGGQPPDTGTLTIGQRDFEVVDVQKIGKIIIHKLKNADNLKEGAEVEGTIDWDKRYSLMKNHTATHVINGAARRVLGQHIWQFGTQKGVKTSRLDISHYRRLSLDEIQKIETLANQTVLNNLKVETTWMPRNDAENKYGFRLYQGGAVPGKEIRVVKVGDWDVEACAGTHLGSTGEIGFIKITHSERVQDGVERLSYSIGIPAVEAVQANERLLVKVSETLAAPIEKLDKTAEKLVTDLKEANAERRKLIKELALGESAALGSAASENKAERIDGVRLLKRDFGEDINVDRIVQTASEVIKNDETIVAMFYGSDGKTARMMVMAGEAAVESGIDAGQIVKHASQTLGGGGGGKPSFAQGGGTRVEKLAEAVRTAEEHLRKQLKSS
jgi:alanyl-tRNA synthetase